MFVINKLTNFSLPLIKLTIFLGNVYYHKSEINYFKLKIKENITTTIQKIVQIKL